MRKVKVAIDEIVRRGWTFEVQVPEPGDEGYDEDSPMTEDQIIEGAKQQAMRHDYSACSSDVNDAEYVAVWIDGVYLNDPR